MNSVKFDLQNYKVFLDAMMCVIVSQILYDFVGAPYALRLVLMVGKLGWIFVNNTWSYEKIKSFFYDSNYELVFFKHSGKSKGDDGEFQLKDESLKGRMSRLAMFMMSSDKTKDRSHHLDAIRGFASMFVAILHTVSYGPAVHEDYRGPFPHKNRWTDYTMRHGNGLVCVFLVLSGYILAKVHWTDKRSRDLPKLILGRIFRFYPIHWFCEILWLVFGSYLVVQYGYTGWSTNSQEGLFSCLTLTHVWRVTTSTGPHSPVCQPPTWSLSVELFLNFFMYICIRLLPVHWCLLLFESLAYYSKWIFFKHPDEGAYYCSFLGYAFFLGVIYQKMFGYFHTNKPIFQMFWDCVGFHLLTNVTEYLYQVDNELYIKLNTCIYTVYLIVALENSFILKRLFGIFRHLGAVSFAIYLCHWPLMLFFGILREYGYIDWINSDYQMGQFLVFVIFIAALIHYQFENKVKDQLDDWYRGQVNNAKPSAKKL